MTYIFCSSRDQKIKNITNLELEQKGWWKSGTFSDSWDPFQTLGLLGIPRTSRDLENLPGTTSTFQDVMRGKDFSGIIISFLYLRNYNFSIVKIS